MNVHAYASVKDEAEREAFRKAVRIMFPAVHYTKDGTPPTRQSALYSSDNCLVGLHIIYRFDGLAGQKGLRDTLRAAAEKPDSVVVFAHASDAGRDLREAVVNLAGLLLAVNVKKVHILRGDLTITCDEFNAAWKLVHALAGAHGHYGRLNRRLAVRQAYALGARMGREPVATLDGVRGAILRMMNANGGSLPSVRKFGKEIGVSVAKAHGLLKEFENERKTAA